MKYAVLFLSLFLCASVLADATASTKIYTVDSIANPTNVVRFDPLGNPRKQVMLGKDAYEAVFYGANQEGLTDLAMTKNLDSSVPFIERYNLSTIGNPNHTHFSVYNDTILISHWIDGSNRRRLFGYYMGDTGIDSLFASYLTNYTADNQMYVSASMRVPGTDTVLMISRADGTGETESIQFWLSTDKGQTFDSIGFLQDWFTVPTRIRIGLFPYDNTVAAILDSADVATIVWHWDRGTRTWAYDGRSNYRSTEIYRAFDGASFNDTSIMTVLMKDNSGSGYNDSLLYSWRNKGTSTYSSGAFLTSTANNGSVPYVGLTYIEATKRLCVVYTVNNTTSLNNFDIYTRYWKGSTWSDPYLVTPTPSRGIQSYKFTLAHRTPAAHGDRLYVNFVQDSNGYQYSKAAVVTFSEGLYTDTIDITSADLPYTIAQSYTLYTINGTKITTGGDAITIANGIKCVKIEGNNDTLVFGTDGNSGSYPGGDVGFDMGASDSVIIKDLYVLHSPPVNRTVSGITLYGLCFRARTSKNVTLDNVYMKAAGGNSKLIWFSGNTTDILAKTTPYNWNILNCKFENNNNHFITRTQWNEVSALVFEKLNWRKTDSLPGFTHHLYMRGCSTINSYWNVLYIEGARAKVDVQNNHFLTDARNDSTSDPTEEYAVSIRSDLGDSSGSPNLGAHLIFANNRIRSGTNYAGGRGLFLSGIGGSSKSADSGIYIANNDFRVHQGFDESTNNAMVVILRQGFNNVIFRDNYLEIQGDTLSSTSSYGQMLIGLRLTTSPAGKNIDIVNNTIVTQFNSGVSQSTWAWSGDDNKGAVAMMFDQCDANMIGWNVDSNITKTNGVHIRYGWYNGAGGTQLVKNHKFQFPGTSDNKDSMWTLYAGDNSNLGIEGNWGQIVDDPIFENNVSDTHIYLSGLVNDDSSSMRYRVTLTINVIDTLNNPVQGAKVRIKSNYNVNYIDSGTTDAAGQWIPSTKKTYWFEASSQSSVPDSMAWNPYTIEASKGASLSDTNYTVAWNTKSPTVKLYSAQGTPPTNYNSRVKNNTKAIGNTRIK